MKAEAMAAAGDHSMTWRKPSSSSITHNLPFWTCGLPRSGSTWPFPWQAGGEAHAQGFSGRQELAKR